MFLIFSTFAVQRYNKKFECATFSAILFILLCNVGKLGRLSKKQKHRKQNKNRENFFELTKNDEPIIYFSLTKIIKILPQRHNS
jgi:hypothetical protein